jgi:hypothetical protein
MTTKERLHELVDELTEAEAVATLLAAERRRNDPMIVALRDAQEEDEEITAEEEASVQEAREEIAAGVPTIPLEQVMQELGDA